MLGDVGPVEQRPWNVTLVGKGLEILGVVGPIQVPDQRLR